jgi:hypothetical protein
MRSTRRVRAALVVAIAAALTTGLAPNASAAVDRSANLTWRDSAVSFAEPSQCAAGIVVLAGQGYHVVAVETAAPAQRSVLNRCIPANYARWKFRFTAEM